MNDVHFSSASNEWHTPGWLFKRLDDEFHFSLDAAATHENAKCPTHFTQADDALKQDWSLVADSRTVWLNPPYGRLIDKFIRKAYDESLKGLTVVCLIPARVDTKWWHDCCAPSEVRFIKGRIKFECAADSAKIAPAPFPSAVIVMGHPASTHYVCYRP